MPEEPVKEVDVIGRDGKPYAVHPDDLERALASGEYTRAPEPIVLPERIPHPHQLHASDYLDAANQGLSSGFSDELTSAGRAFANARRGKHIRPAEHGGGIRDDYDLYQRSQNSALQRAQEAHPGAMGAMNLLGAVAQNAVLPGTSLLTKGVPFLKRAVGNAVQGGIEGGISGFGSATGDMTDRLWGGAKGAGFGTASGLITPLVGEGLKRVSQRVVNALPDFMAPVGRAIPGVHVPGADAVQHKILEKLQKDGVSLDQAEAIIKRYADAGTPLTLADVGGENTLALSRAALTPSTEGKNSAWDYLVARTMGGKDRVKGYVTEAFRDASGHLNTAKPLNMEDPFETVSKAAIASRKAAAGPAYKAAFQDAANAGFRVEPDSVLVNFLEKPNFKAAYRRAYARANNKIHVEPDGRVIEEKLPLIYDREGKVMVDKLDLETLDAIKRVMGDKAYAGANPLSKHAMLNEDLANYSHALSQYTEHVKAIAPPSYSAALAQFQDASRLIAASKQGRKFDTMNPTQLADILHGLNDAEREHFLLGAIDDIRNNVLTGNPGRDYVPRIFDGGNRELALKQLFNKPGAFEVFKQKMKDEARLRLTYDRMRGNSTTVAQAEAMRDLGDETGGIWNNIMGLDVKGTARAALNRSEGVRGRNAAAAVPMLFDPNPMNTVRLLRRTQEALNKQAVKPSKAGFIPGNVSGLLVPKTDQRR